MTDLISLFAEGIYDIFDRTKDVPLYVLKHPETGRTIAECMTREMCEREARWNDIETPFEIKCVTRRPPFWFSRPPRFIRPWPQKKTDEMVAMYVDGTPIREMVDYFDASYTSLAKKCRKLGLPIRGKNEWSEQEERTVVEQYRSREFSEHATGINRTWAAARARLMKLGEWVPASSWGWTPDEYLKIREMYDAQQLDLDAIVEQSGRSVKSIVGALKKQGVKAYASEGRHGGRWSQREELLINFLYDEGMTIDEIGENSRRLCKAIGRHLGKTAGSLSTRSRSGRFIKPGRRSIRLLEKTSEFD